MDEMNYERAMQTLDGYCENCLWCDGCAETREDEECLYFTSYTDRTDSSDELDEDERSYFDELAYRQRAYAAIIYSMREE